MGSMTVPAEALYGAQTARARENFPISGIVFPRPFLRALGMVKEHAAKVNRELGLIDERVALAVMDAAEEVIIGDLDDHFPLDVFQTGSGTSSNMNANEVIASLAFPLAVFTGVAAPAMVGTLLGPDWSESVPLLRALAPAGLIVSMNVATGWVYLSLGRTDRQLRWRLIGSAAAMPWS